jgi:hypothetical protein
MNKNKEIYNWCLTHCPHRPRTFDEWSKKGFFIIKGEKSIGKNEEGIAVFSEEQVGEHDWYEMDIDEGD